MLFKNRLHSLNIASRKHDFVLILTAPTSPTTLTSQSSSSPSTSTLRSTAAQTTTSAYGTKMR